MYNCLEQIYDSRDQSEGMDVMKQIYKQQLYNKPWKKFSKLKLVKTLMDDMLDEDDLVEQHMRNFHKFLRKNWPKGGYEDSDDDDEEEEEKTEEMDDLDHEIASIREME